MATTPVARVAHLKVIAETAAKRIIASAQAGASEEAIAEIAVRVAAIHPGVERWPVKTGTDKDHLAVGRNILNGADLGEGVVKTTVEELLTFERAPDMPDVKSQFAKNSFYQNNRAKPTEVTIWEITATVKEAKLEDDGDYHLVLAGSSGKTMIGEIPKDGSKFEKNAEWLSVIKSARAAVEKKHDDKPLPAVGFTTAEMAPPTVDRFAGEGVVAAAEKAVEAAAMVQINAKARIRGVGFFDSDHGQTGVAKRTAIELHPILFLEWI